MNVLLIDADSTIPNIALGKLSSYYKGKGDNVDFMALNIPYYPNRKHTIHYVDTNKYDKVYCSVIFNGSIDYIRGDNIEFGGTGYDLGIRLPDYIENLPVDYTLYPNNDTSYGFITRGCIRNCYFCVVPKKEGWIHQVNTVDNIVRHDKVKFLDNNILAFDGHLAILEELINKNIHCQFNQGLDIRLVNPINSKLLSELNYIGEYFFAFDDWKYLKIINDKLSLLSWRKDWQVKFFLYVNPAMPVSTIINRINWCKENKCLPYVMRDISCWSSSYNNFYIDLAAYCNQPNIFKKMDFMDFLSRRHTNQDRINFSAKLYEEAMSGKG